MLTQDSISMMRTHSDDDSNIMPEFLALKAVHRRRHAQIFGADGADPRREIWPLIIVDKMIVQLGTAVVPLSTEEGRACGISKKRRKRSMHSFY